MKTHLNEKIKDYFWLLTENNIKLKSCMFNFNSTTEIRGWMSVGGCHTAESLDFEFLTLFLTFLALNPFRISQAFHLLFLTVITLINLVLFIFLIRLLIELRANYCTRFVRAMHNDDSFIKWFPFYCAHCWFQETLLFFHKDGLFHRSFLNMRFTFFDTINKLFLYFRTDFILFAIPMDNLNNFLSGKSIAVALFPRTIVYF